LDQYNEEGDGMKCWYIIDTTCDRPPGICEECEKYEDWRRERERICKEIQSDESKIPIVCLPPITKEHIIWAIRHPNRKRKAPNVIELRHELTAEEEELLIKLIEYHKETLKLLAE